MEIVLLVPHDLVKCQVLQIRHSLYVQLEVFNLGFPLLLCVHQSQELLSRRADRCLLDSIHLRVVLYWDLDL